MSTRTSIIQGLLVSSLACAAVAGCVRLDEEHCIVNGGDFACPDEGQLCATEIEGFREPSDAGDGCVSIEGTERYFEEYLVHVKYGLPSSLWPHGAEEDDVDSVAGVLVRAVEEQGLECEVDAESVRELEPLWRGVRSVRGYLERRDRVSVDAMTLQVGQVGAIEGFNAGVDGWVNGC